MRLRSLNEVGAAEGTVQLRASEHSDLILYPHPSQHDPNDPLRWPRWKKHIAFASVCAFTFLTNFAVGGLAPAFYILSLEFHKTQQQTSDLLIWPVLVLGLFNFVHVPLANYFGKRPVFVFNSLLLTVADIWGACATSFRSLLWSNIAAALVGSSTEALGAAMVNDLYFLHERAGKMSIYMNSISGGNTIGPLICGFIVSGASWRWHKWLAAILSGINFLCVLLFVPETRFNREDLGERSLVVSSETPLPLITVSRMPNPNAKGISHAAAAPSISPSPERAEVLKKTWLQELSLSSGTLRDTRLWQLFIRPFPLIVYPAVVFAFLGYAVSLAWVITINLLNPFTMQGPPYNWKADIQGLINIPGLLGNLFGAFTGGWLVDRYCKWRTRKTKGVFEAESRLILLLVPIVTVPAGCVLYGYGTQETLHWTTLFFGFGMISVGLTATPIITTVYVADSYLPVAPDALLLVNGFKNIVAFGFVYGINPWIAAVGPVDVFWTQAAIYVAIVGGGMALLMGFGKHIRRVTSAWRMIL
ncbi:MAG: hypothetical protein M1820_006669 [Bogoriella megaspora]|nr:MAG: hypothetical protein M1820_006669 [Bogoriella megaspora]